MASGTRGAKRRGMSLEEVDQFMEECSKLLGENDDSEPRRIPLLLRPENQDLMKMKPYTKAHQKSIHLGICSICNG